MLKSLQLGNFRAFKYATFDFAPITILAGGNSSGKSSILQALTAAIQTSGDRVFPFDYAVNGPLAQMGSFRNVVHGHNAKNSFEVGLRFQVGEVTYLSRGVFKVADGAPNLFPRSVELSSSRGETLEIDWNQKQQKFRLKVQPKVAADRGGEEFADIIGELARNEGTNSKAVLQDVLAKSAGDSSRAVELLTEYLRVRLDEATAPFTASAPDPEGALREFEQRPYFKALRQSMLAQFEALRRTISYVGPVRAYPSRYYSLAKQVVGVDPFGETVSYLLASWKERRSPKFQKVKDALVSLELASDLSAELELGEFLKLMIKSRVGAFPDTIADVGFGVSQVLPIVVADTALDEGGTLLINQPEVHLHPSSQALLGNYFANGVLSARKRYVIETHSEYLITRLRVLIAKGVLKEEDVVIYYCSPSADNASSEVVMVKPKKDGSLEGMPSSFFRTYASDTFELAMAAMDDDDAEE
jgi:predicted ATPase